MPTKRSDAPTIIGTPEVPVVDEAEHFIQCPVCDQAFDCRDLGQVMHHFPDVHVPLQDDD